MKLETNTFLSVPRMFWSEWKWRVRFWLGPKH